MFRLGATGAGLLLVFLNNHWTWAHAPRQYLLVFPAGALLGLATLVLPGRDPTSEAVAVAFSFLASTGLPLLALKMLSEQTLTARASASQNDLTELREQIELIAADYAVRLREAGQDPTDWLA